MRSLTTSRGSFQEIGIGRHCKARRTYLPRCTRSNTAQTPAIEGCVSCIGAAADQLHLTGNGSRASPGPSTPRYTVDEQMRRRTD